MGKLFDKYIGEVDPPRRYEFDDLTYDSAASTIRIYGGWKAKWFERVVIALFAAVALLGLFGILTGGYVFGVINLVQGLLYTAWFLRSHIRSQKKVKMAKALQAEIVAARAIGAGSQYTTTAFADVNDEMDNLAEQAKELAKLDKTALLSLARMHKVAGRSRMNKDELVYSLAHCHGLPTIFIYEPEFDTTSNQVGERHV